MKTCLVTGGAGFIGSALLRHLFENTDTELVNVDKLTYAGNRWSLRELEGNPRYRFAHLDILDRDGLDRLFKECRPDSVVHLAAETHVDCSIDDPQRFVRNNIEGSFVLLEASLAYWRQLPVQRQKSFRFLQVSSDEVYGDLDHAAHAATEESRYAPSSPYAASKAAADHFVRAWWRTYGFPTLVTHSSNNYGPRQYPEKLLPLCLVNAIANKPLPLYGDGRQQRDWLYVDDHAEALVQVLQRGQPGESYNIGGGCVKSNIDIVTALCECLEQFREAGRFPALQACDPNRSFTDLIRHVGDRPGHDRRYAIDSSRIACELGWKPRVGLEEGLAKTVTWYLDNPDWIAATSLSLSS